MRAGRLARALVACAIAVTGVASGVGAEEQWRATKAGWVSGPVEHVDTLVTDAAGGVSAKLHRNTLYVTTFRSFSIYDVRDALTPELLSTTPLGVQLFNEQPDTNGRILLLGNDSDSLEAGVNPLRLRFAGSLDVWDVRDKRNPRPLASLPLPKREHIWTCVLDCEYAYGAGGSIVDLSDPRNPLIVGDWVEQTGTNPAGGRFHTIEEVAPGLVLTGSATMFYLDARENPAAPRVLATAELALTRPGFPSNPTSLPAHVEWPAAPGGLLLMAMETPFGGTCDDTGGGFRTYDARDWLSSQALTVADEYVFSDTPGTYTNGRAPHHVWGCSAYAFDHAENFAETGRVAVAWFEDGLRLLEVGDDGAIEEVGGFVPAGGSTATPLWRNDEVLYAVDLYRGVDILRVRAD